MYVATKNKIDNMISCGNSNMKYLSDNTKYSSDVSLCTICTSNEVESEPIAMHFALQVRIF